MAYITGSVTDGFGVLPFSLSAGTQLSMSIQNSLPGVSYYGLETVLDRNGFYNTTTAKNLSGSFILGSGIVDVVYDNYKMVAAVAPGGGTLTYTPAVAIEADTLRTRGTGASLGRVDFDTLVASSYNQRVVNSGGYVESPDSITAAIAATPILKDASFLYIPSGYSSGTAFSELSTNDYGDLTWTRGSDAFRTNASGLIQRVPWNLLPVSEDFSSGVWNKQNATISTNTTTSPNGTLTADKLIPDTTSAQHRIFIVGPSIATADYTFSCYAKADGYNFLSLGNAGGITGGAIIFNLSNGAISGTTSGVTPTITNVENGWYRCSISLTTTPSFSWWIIARSSNSTADYTGNGTDGVSIWGAQLVGGTSAQSYLPTTTRLNVPRLDYTYGTSPASLLEPQRTNLALRSEEFNVGWAITATITANTTTSPDGSQNADTITGSGFIGRSISATGIHTFSVYAKGGTANTIRLNVFDGVIDRGAYYNLTTGAITGAYGSPISTTSNSVGNGWYRISITTNNATISYFQIHIDSAATCFIFGAQFELGSYPTTYIPTTSATATRVADSFSRNNIYTNGLITSSGGTWYTELRNNISYVRDAGGTGVFVGDDISATNSFRFKTFGGGGRISIVKSIATTESILYTTTTDTVKFAINWNGSTADLFVNGTKQVSATAFTATALEFLAHATTGDVPKFIQQMALYSQPLAGVDMGVLTGANYYPSFLNMAQALNYTIA